MNTQQQNTRTAALGDLIEAVGYERRNTALAVDTEIKGITADSREVVPGGLFVAVRGVAVDGHRSLAVYRRRVGADVECRGVGNHAGIIGTPFFGRGARRQGRRRHQCDRALAYHSAFAGEYSHLSIRGLRGKKPETDLRQGERPENRLIFSLLCGCSTERPYIKAVSGILTHHLNNHAAIMDFYAQPLLIFLAISLGTALRFTTTWRVLARK